MPSTYKFNIVIENTLVDDYVTEKFFEGLKSASLMVYLGGYHPLIQLYIYIYIYIMYISVAGGVLGRLPYSNPVIHIHIYVYTYTHILYIVYTYYIYCLYI